MVFAGIPHENHISERKSDTNISKVFEDRSTAVLFIKYPPGTFRPRME